MRWQNKITKTELKHVKKWVGNTLTAFKLQAKYLAETRKTEDNDFSEPCHVCKSVARKLGLKV